MDCLVSLSFHLYVYLPWLSSSVFRCLSVSVRDALRRLDNTFKSSRSFNDNVRTNYDLRCAVLVNRSALRASSCSGKPVVCMCTDLSTLQTHRTVRRQLTGRSGVRLAWKTRHLYMCFHRRTSAAARVRPGHCNRPIVRLPTYPGGSFAASPPASACSTASVPADVIK